jgi:hypothetical protein
MSSSYGRLFPTWKKLDVGLAGFHGHDDIIDIESEARWTRGMVGT